MKLQKKEYTTQAEKRKDFVIGVSIFVGLNVLLFVIITSVLGFLSDLPGGGSADPTIMVCFGSLLMYVTPLLINIAVPIYFALTRSWIALGILGAFAGSLLLALIVGVIAMIFCFAISASQ